MYKKERPGFQKPASGNISYEKLRYLPSESLPLQKKQLYSQILASSSYPMVSVCARPFSHMCSKNVNV